MLIICDPCHINAVPMIFGIVSHAVGSCIIKINWHQSSPTPAISCCLLTLDYHCGYTIHTTEFYISLANSIVACFRTDCARSNVVKLLLLIKIVFQWTCRRDWSEFDGIFNEHELSVSPQLPACASGHWPPMKSESVKVNVTQMSIRNLCAFEAFICIT